MKFAPRNRKDRLFSIDAICNAYDEFHKRYPAKKEVEQIAVGLVQKSRSTLPREGTGKLMISLHQDFRKQNLKIGRDRLFPILRETELLVLAKC